jgi:lysophospholipase L1-like esterase
VLSLKVPILALPIALGGCAPQSAPPAAPRAQARPEASEAEPGPEPAATRAATSSAQIPAPTKQVRPESEAEAAAAPPAPLPKATVPEGTTVLHIGDSMAGALGIELGKALRASGVKAILRFKTASFIPTWAWGQSLGLYLAQYNPDLTLITLGANEVAMQDPSQRAGAIRRLVRQLDGRACVWIAPPLWAAGDTGLLPVIRDNCAPCLFMDTNALVKNMPRLKDKIHPTMPAREIWAKFVVDWLAHQRDPDGERPWDLLPPDAPNPRGPAPTLDFNRLGPTATQP